jgi:DNA-binding beta-propeller fold protein YncE
VHVPAIYVSDWRLHCVWRLNGLAGPARGRLGVGGTGVGQFNTPCGLAFDSRGRVYVADRGNHRIVRADDVDGAGWATLGTPGAGIGHLNTPADEPCKQFFESAQAEDYPDWASRWARLWRPERDDKVPQSQRVVATGRSVFWKNVNG